MSWKDSVFNSVVGILNPRKESLLSPYDTLQTKSTLQQRLQMKSFTNLTKRQADIVWEQCYSFGFQSNFTPSTALISVQKKALHVLSSGHWDGRLKQIISSWILVFVQFKSIALSYYPVLTLATV